jgi:hypothetical protein
MHPYFAEYMLQEYARTIDRNLRRPRLERRGAARRSLPRFLRR